MIIRMSDDNNNRAYKINAMFLNEANSVSDGALKKKKNDI